jgi:hypothetical protein
MLRSCKAGSVVQVQVRAPIRSLSSIRQNTDLVCRRWQDRSLQRAPCAGSPIGRRHLAQNESSASSNLAWRTILCPRSPIGRGPALNAGKCRFEACRGYAPVAQSAEAAVSRAACCRFESCAAHQFRLPSPSGKGIWPTPRHSAVRVRQGAPFKQQPCKRVREVRAAADNRVVGGAVPPACTNPDAKP